MAKRISIKDKIFDFCYRFKYGTVMFLVGVIVIFWDLLSKLITDGKTAEVINGFFRVESTHNPGGAWSIMGEHPEVLIVLSVLFIVFLLLGNWFFQEKNYFYAISMGLVISGALGNLYDRIKYGKVRDFIKLEFMDFPTFNLADCAITVGVILLCIYFIFVVPYYIKKKEKMELAQQEATTVKTSVLDSIELQDNSNVIEVESDGKTAESNEQVHEDIIKDKEIIESEDNNEDLKIKPNEQKSEAYEEKSSKIKRSRRTKLGSNRKNNSNENIVSRKNSRKFNSKANSKQNVNNNTKDELVSNTELKNTETVENNQEPKSTKNKPSSKTSKKNVAKKENDNVVIEKAKSTKKATTAKKSTSTKKSTSKKATENKESKTKTTKSKQSTVTKKESKDTSVESKPKTRKSSKKDVKDE